MFFEASVSWHRDPAPTVARRTWPLLKNIRRDTAKHRVADVRNPERVD